MNPRDTDARIRSDARAREIGCLPALAVIGLGGSDWIHILEGSDVMTAPVMPTSGPWAYTFRAGECSEGTITSEDDWLVAVVAGQNHGQWRDTDDNGDTEFEANARLIVAACNAFQRHFADPVAAAEGNMLGKMVEALRKAAPIVETDLATSREYSDSDWTGQSQEALDAITSVLAQVREPHSTEASEVRK